MHCEEPSPKLTNTSFLQFGHFKVMHEQKSMSLTFINKPSNSTIYPEYSLLDYKTLLEIQLDFLHDIDLTTQQMKKKKRTFKRWGIMEKL